MDDKNLIIGAVAAILVLLGFLYVVFAVLHAVMVLLPIVLVGGIVAGLVAYKLKS